MKIEITGHIVNENGVLKGIIEMPVIEAQRLLSLGAAVPVVELPGEDGNGNSDAQGAMQKPTEKVNPPKKIYFGTGGKKPK